MTLNRFSGPIPGQSLTTEPGGAPWEHPPQFNDLNEFLENIFDKLVEKRQALRLAALLKSGISAEEIARMIIFNLFTTGAITPDIALQATRPVLYQIVAIGKNLNISNIKIMRPDFEQQDFMKNVTGMLKPEAFEQQEQITEATQPTFKGILGTL